MDYYKVLNIDQNSTNEDIYIAYQEKLSKLKLKFRYHNGMLVNFHGQNVSLTIEINQIRNDT